MDLIITILVAVVIAVASWYLTSLPMDNIIRIMIRVATVVVVGLWLIGRFGGSIPNVMP